MRKKKTTPLKILMSKELHKSIAKKKRKKTCQNPLRNEVWTQVISIGFHDTGILEKYSVLSDILEVDSKQSTML